MPRRRIRWPSRTGLRQVVGVTGHTDTVTGRLEILRVQHVVEDDQRHVLARRRVDPDSGAVASTLAAIAAASSTSDNLVPPNLVFARAEATLGEICGVLRDVWGTYREPARL